MDTIKNMIDTHPHSAGVDTDALVRCITACFECEQSCTSCADACLAEDMVKDLRHCIRLNLDCADICEVTGRMMLRQTEPDWEVLRAQLESCMRACRACGEECSRHGSEHEHCRVCAESCRRCEEACQELLSHAGNMAHA